MLGVEEVKEIKMGKKTELRGPGWVFILFGTDKARRWPPFIPFWSTLIPAEFMHGIADDNCTLFSAVCLALLKEPSRALLRVSMK